MRFLAHVFRLGVKELLTLWREPMLLLFVLYAFTAQVYMTGQGMTFDLKNAALAIVDEDRSQLSLRLWQAFREPFFRGPVPVAFDRVDRSLDRADQTFILNIPPHFERDVMQNLHPALQLNVDATAVSQAFIGAAYVQRIVSEELNRHLGTSKLGTPPPIDLRERVKYNPNRESPWFTSVTQLLMAITMISIILPATALLREREHGTIEHLLVMPLSPAEIMFSKVWSSSLVVLISVGLCLVLVIEAGFHVPIRGSIALFFVAALLYQFATAGLGMVLATATRTVPQMALMTILILGPMVFLSGAWTPPEAMPRGIQWLMYASPLKYFTDIATGIVFRGAGLAQLWPDFATMTGVGVALYALALARFRAHFSSVRL